MKCKKLTFILLVSMLLCGCSETETSKRINSEDIISTDNTVEQTTYVADTNYTGADVPAELYEIPFQKTEDYIKNMDLIKQLSKDEIWQYVVTATHYFKDVYGNNYISISSDQDGFMEKINGIDQDSGYAVQMNDADLVTDFGSNLMQMYVDNKIEASVDYSTDQSLLYSDMYRYYLRGAMTITVSGKKQCAAYSKELGISLTDGEPTTVAVEVSFVPNNPNEILSCEILKYIE